MVQAARITPFAPALWWVAQALYPLPEPRKIVLVVTNGVPDDSRGALEAIRKIGKLCTELYWIGIHLQGIRELFLGRTRAVRALTELGPALFGLWKQA